MTAPAIPVFARVIGPQFQSLSPILRQLHDERVRKRYRGACEVHRGSNAIARLFASIARLPPAAVSSPLTVTIESSSARETWTRNFNGHEMRSLIRERAGLLRERLGPMEFAFALRATPTTIDWQILSVSALGVPLPVRWFASTTARESIVDGRYHFEVRATLPWLGLLVHYHGSLEEDK